MRSLLSVFLIFILSACFKTQSEIHYEGLTKKGNVWHVDKMRVVSTHYATGEGDIDTTYLDVGDFTFEEGKKGENNGIMKFNGSVLITPSANVYYGPFELPFETATSSLISDVTIYDITHIKKDKLKMLVSSYHNNWFSQQFDFGFYFECTRK
jgi:hypothetical protein